MKPKTSLLLYRMLWLASKPVYPTFLNITDSFEGWAYRSGLLKQIQRLEADGYLESKLDKKTGKRLHRLTAAGMQIAKGKRDPEGAWNTPWDRKWRLFLFDIPESQSGVRRALTRALATAGCGCLQGSVWIAPRLPTSLEALVDGGQKDCAKLLLLHAESKGSVVDESMVAAAWDFDAINKGYGHYLKTIAKLPQALDATGAEEVADWTATEAEAWDRALANDPLLPRELLPREYLGCKAFAKRNAALTQVAAVTRALTLPR